MRSASALTPPPSLVAAAPAAAPVRTRSPGLDAVRALATVAMVFGHTADGLLSDAARAQKAVQTYWTFRGLTAPLFLFVAGWAVMASVERGKVTGQALVRKRLPRVGLLLFWGYLLRFPGWDLWGLFKGRHEPWAALLGFDALHCIAVSLLLAVGVVAYVRSARARAIVFGTLTVLLPLASGALVGAVVSWGTPLFLRQPFVPDASSPFPLLPWAAYFFAGAFCGQLLALVKGGQHGRALGMVLLGAGLTFVCARIGAADALTSPTLFGYRLGQVVVIAGVGMALPMVIAQRLALLGRSSLVVYVFHLPIVYGWSTFPGLNARIGHALTLWQVAGLALVLLMLGLAFAEGIRAWKRRRAQPVPAAA
jgi:uncharacterized membrane protein